MRRFASGRLISIINNDLSGIRLLFGVGFLQFFNALLLTVIADTALHVAHIARTHDCIRLFLSQSLL